MYHKLKKYSTPVLLNCMMYYGNKFQEIKRQRRVSFNRFIVVQFIIEIWMYTIHYNNNEISTTEYNNNTCLNVKII